MLRDPVKDINTLLIGEPRRRSTPRGCAPLRAPMPRELAQAARADARRLAPALRGGDVYTDDRAPVEWLVDKSIVGYAAGDR